MKSFASRLVAWQRSSGRHHLPWQEGIVGTDLANPYPIWLSEIMLQQTQVVTVIPYFLRFMASFPTVQALADAPEEAVLGLWAGLGYYRRARMLHRCAKEVVDTHGGYWPDTAEALATLPGIGPSTAAAVAVFAFNQRAAILDGNVKRVLARHAGVYGDLADKDVLERLWQLANERLPRRAVDYRAYTQGLMDLGAQLCTRSKPDCARCPLREDCYAAMHDDVAALPTKSQKRAKRREVWEVELRVNKQRLWLERRTEAAHGGIWAGLWMAPMGLMDVEAGSVDDALIHELTHKTLMLIPNVRKIQGRGEFNASCEGRWFPLPLADDAPVPAALRRLVDRWL